MRTSIAVITVLFVATLFVEPLTYRAEGEPISFACVGIIAAGMLRRRSHKRNSP